MGPAALVPGAIDDRARIHAALRCVPADDRDRWLRIGMAIKAALGEDGFELWDEWSRSSDRYHATDARTVWRSIRPDGGIGLGTLFFEAAKHGYLPNRPEQTAPAHEASASRPEPAAQGGGGDTPADQHCNRATLP